MSGAVVQANGASERDATSDAAASALRRATASGKPRKSRAGGRELKRSSDRDPTLIGEAMDQLIVEKGWSHASAVATVSSQWAELVGTDLAAHVVPESFDDGRLVLRAESTAWATQVRLLLPQLRRTIDHAVGAGVVTDISVVGPQAPSWKAGPRHVAGRGPRDTYG